jgi:hypothetical protein
VTEYITHAKHVKGRLSTSSMKTFSWNDIFKEAKNGMPMLYGVLAGAVSRKRRDNSFET